MKKWICRALLIVLPALVALYILSWWVAGI